jgi:hypothetical protein
MDNGTRSMIAKTSMKDISLVQVSKGVTAWKKFIPKKPVMKAKGMKRAVITVKVFIMSFMRLLIIDK